MKHVGTGARLHSIWKGMIARCHNQRSKGYLWYGARGITVDPNWRSFVGFLDWALDAGYRRGLTIDRIDADGNYTPLNCRWITKELNVIRRELPNDGSYLTNLSGKLTEAIIADAGLRTKSFKMSDGLGLYLHVFPTGRRSWRFAYRFNDKHCLLTIGRFPDVSIAEARERCLIARSQVSRGRSPAVIKQETVARRLRRHP